MSKNYPKPYVIAEIRMPHGAIHRIPVRSINQIKKIYYRQVYNRHMSINNLAGKIVFDVGAMAGVYSVMAALAGAERVMAIEPNKANYSLLSENIILNGLINVDSFPMIISNQDNIKMKLYIREPSSHSIIRFAGETISEMVPSITLDSLAKEFNITPDFVKMDITGAEYLAMLGAKDLLDHGHTEFAVATYHSNKVHSNIVKLLEQYDYDIQEMGTEYHGDRFIYAWKEKHYQEQSILSKDV